MMNEHKELLPQLAAYHDGELNAADTKNIEHHLEGCSSCRLLLEDFEALDVAVLGLEQATLYDRGIYLRVLAEIGRDEVSVPTKAQRSPWIVASVAAAAVLLLGLGINIFWQQSEPRLADVTPTPADVSKHQFNDEVERAELKPLAADADLPTDRVKTPEAAVAAEQAPDPGAQSADSKVLAVTTETTKPTDVTTAPMSLEIGDSGIPQDSDWLARLFDSLNVNVHFRALSSYDLESDRMVALDLIEINLIPEFEPAFVGIGYALGDLLDPGHDIAITEPVELSAEQSHLVLSLRLEQSALASRTNNQVASEAAAVRMADISWRLATITADLNDVHVAIRAQTAVMRKQPALTARSMSRLATLAGLIQD